MASSIQCIIFDLDNTLYNQVDYIEDLMEHISLLLSRKYNLDVDETSKVLLSYWMEKGPFYGHFFDDIVQKLSIDKNEAQKLITTSHSYRPNIRPYPGVLAALDKLQKNYSLAMITDGNEEVQQNKIDALGIEQYFGKILYATENNMKPSPEPYVAVLDHFKLQPEEAIYVGDNPTVDFITPSIMRMMTIRVLSGFFKDIQLDDQHEATYTINNVGEIFDVLGTLQRK